MILYRYLLLYRDSREVDRVEDHVPSEREGHLPLRLPPAPPGEDPRLPQLGLERPPSRLRPQPPRSPPQAPPRQHAPTAEAQQPRQVRDLGIHTSYWPISREL